MTGLANYPERDYCTYTLADEGGIWRESTVVITADEMDKFSSGQLKPLYHAYKFASGRIWDVVNGWRADTKSELPSLPASGRNFETGAYRDADNNKLDYEAFLSPIVLERYARYMHKNRVQSDGRLRDGDNWQKGMPQEVYLKSAFRHFMEWWSIHRGRQTTKAEDLEEALCALLFNVQGYLFEQLKKKASSNENRPIEKALGAGSSDQHSGGSVSSVGNSDYGIPSVRHPR